MEICQAAQIVIVGIEIFGRLALRSLDLGALELRHDRADDAFGHLVLQLKDIVERALETIGPAMHTCRRVDELACYADPIRCYANAAFPDVTHPQLTNA